MMTGMQAIEIAASLTAGSISGYHRYFRVNDFVVDTIELQVVAMAWPRMARSAFPIRNRGDSVAEALA